MTTREQTPEQSLEAAINAIDHRRNMRVIALRHATAHAGKRGSFTLDPAKVVVMAEAFFSFLMEVER